MAAKARPRPETINRLRNAVYPSYAMLAGMQLELFTPLGDGPMDAVALAGALGVEPDRLSRLLYALVNAGLLTVADGRFANTEEADRFLVKGRPDYMGSAHELLSGLWSACLETAGSVREDRPRAEHDFHEMSEDELTGFLRGLHPAALAAGRVLANKLGFASRRRLLDVAGGSAGLAIGACKTCPGLEASVAELANVAPITESFIRDAGMADRIAVQPVDVLERAPDGPFDAVLLRNFLQVLSAEDARRAVANVGQAVEPGGVVHVIGRIVDDTRLAPAETAAFDIVFLNLYRAGRAYTYAEHRAWFAEAGFGEPEFALLADGFVVATARKAG